LFNSDVWFIARFAEFILFTSSCKRIFCIIFAGGNNGIMNNYNGYYYENNSLNQDGNGTTGESPLIIDESGYESSESSVYDIMSEDEEYNNDVEGFPVDQDDVANKNIDAA
jgi:hypothetical protein